MKMGSVQEDFDGIFQPVVLLDWIVIGWMASGWVLDGLDQHGRRYWMDWMDFSISSWIQQTKRVSCKP
jgi:hypothetical protein